MTLSSQGVSSRESLQSVRSLFDRPLLKIYYGQDAFIVPKDTAKTKPSLYHQAACFLCSSIKKTKKGTEVRWLKGMTKSTGKWL